MRGQKPSCTACRVTEKAPEITAWDATTVATVASPTSAASPHSGAIRKNGLRIAAGSRSSNAPWPK
ncbi:Uncharacterised protein [Bordetella pertussis]|nr:Uncharacterised protein [Bordetella pertussis]CFT95717.1 Uncharacterised protein [Bordetella pertussis]